MQQIISVFGLDWRLLVIQGFNFALLLLVLWYFLYRPVLRIIDERRNKIAESMRIAQQAQHTLENAKLESDGIVGQAAREAEGLVAAARARSETLGSEIVKSAQGRADGLLVEARARAEEAKRQALQESEREIARAALLAAEKILRKNA